MLNGVRDDGAAAAAGEIPDETAGPFPGDGSNGPDLLAESGVVRSDIRSSFGGANSTAQGVPMDLELVISDLAGGGAAQLGTVTGNIRTGYTVSLAVGVDTTTTPAHGPGGRAGPPSGSR